MIAVSAYKLPQSVKGTVRHLELIRKRRKSEICACLSRCGRVLQVHVSFSILTKLQYGHEPRPFHVNERHSPN